MDSPPAPKRPNEDEGDIPDPKRVKTVAASESNPDSEGKSDMEMAAPQVDQILAPDAARSQPNTAAPDTEENMSVKLAGKSRKGRGKGKEKDAQNPGRKRSGRRRNEEPAEGAAAAEDAEKSSEPKAPRRPKRMCALLIGFCGSGYRGMQIQQNGTKTIENTLFDALVRAGAVSADNADNPVKVGIARCARTDAGVHAVGNVVSLKMITEGPGIEDMTARINEELPPDIRLWGHIRVQNSFNPRSLCDSRKYTYFFPSYLLIPPKPTSAQYRVLTEHAASLSPPMSSPIVNHPFWVDGGESSTEAEDMARKRAWRVAPEQLAQLRTSAQKYIATHNFYNFTVNAAFSDRSNQRVMKNIVIADPVVYGATEWISVLFHGQSFMMHQRKMISALVLACRTGTPPQIIDELYGPRAVFIPKMPALGLLLEEPLFDSYNGRMAKVNEKFQPGDADYRPPIDFSLHREAMDAFKQTYIYDNMRLVEDRDGLFDAWIRMVDAYGGADLLYLNPRGTIPPAAVYKSGERHRKGAFKEKKLFDATSFPDVKGSLDAEEEEEEEVQVDKRKREEMEG